ncbi:flagellar hook-basal body complex protein FliE [Gallaecimonas sp. GXIMD4217]|uniref:flagellar hook-basal body complex protein FliE n=1 Tax=Gallaecimonas sp. GXIMD4217 TaxID=3131927 RepID=UPI00311B18F0
MKIGANPLMQEMQALSRQAQSQLGSPMGLDKAQQLGGPVGQGDAVKGPSGDFASLFKQALDHVNGLQQESAQMARAVELGDPKVSVADAMIASQKAGIAFQATVQVRNKVVQAYQDVMNMPV